MIVAFVIAQLADVGSALLMPRDLEANPIMRMLLDQPVAAVAAKIAVIVLGIAAVSLIRRKKPRLAPWVYATGIVAGVLGLYTNLAVIRALAEGA